ncbi:ABC transporter ATP-binding protein [Clostridium aciditolerans]|uniref:ABC transporter ATP-binding protein n=1 Tax=Clostridium aciditolerans TaxID=339861 RepID=A0A934M6S3_9CLOT|nr:ABC transporter ATP-binding protein [Clostridium aciditolerans]MBI6873301.1 ABC transporter ATP-binding protein [Clostridium aciditolerans]
MLQVKNLYKSYRTKDIQYDVLKNVSFKINKGDFVAVMGSSGSGKTTLLNSISGFIPFDKGEILLNESNIVNLKEKEIANIRNKKLGFVFQDFMLLDGLTIFENICLPQIISSKNVASMEASANKLCEIFGISHIKDKYPAEISGGEKQRTAVARALINNPLLILADEPTGNLDSKSSRAVIDAFIRAKNKLSATIFMVTHDSFSASFCDKVIVLKDGKIYKELNKNSTRSEFLDLLLKTLKELGGDNNDNE